MTGTKKLDNNTKYKRDKPKKDKSKKDDGIEIVLIDIDDILETAKNIILETHGGIAYSDIKYLHNHTTPLRFSIPKQDRKGKCNRINPPDEEGGCGETGGACICEKPEGHSDNCECELCGEEF